MTSTPVTLVLQIYRNLDNRSQNLPDDGPLALELHQMRAKALHEVFDGAAGYITVTNWGATNDATSHELIEMTVVALAAPMLTTSLTPVLQEIAKYVGEKLGEKVADTATTNVIDWIITKLLPKQQRREIADYTMKTADGTSVQIDAPGTTQVQVRVWSKDGTFSEATFGGGAPATPSAAS